MGDLWSFDDQINKYIVSLEPDINVIDFKPGVHKFIIVASDRLRDAMDPQAAVDIVSNYESTSTIHPDKRNCSIRLITEAIGRWQERRINADDISVIVAFFDDEFISID